MNEQRPDREMVKRLALTEMQLDAACRYPTATERFIPASLGDARLIVHDPVTGNLLSGLMSSVSRGVLMIHDLLWSKLLPGLDKAIREHEAKRRAT